MRLISKSQIKSTPENRDISEFSVCSEFKNLADFKTAYVKGEGEEPSFC